MQQLRQIASERDLSIEELKVELEAALAAAYKKYKGVQGDVEVRFDSSVKSGAVIYKEVVGEVLEPSLQVALETARKRDPEAQVGDFLPFEVDPNIFGRIAASAFKQTLNTKLREAEYRQIEEQFQEQMGSVVSGIVTRRENSGVYLSVGRYEVFLPRGEQIQTDDYRPQERLKVVVQSIEKPERGPARVIVSRSSPELIRRMLEDEVPELHEGIVEIKGIARVPGQRAKIAVISHDERIDAVGSCVGQRGSRIQILMDELRPEKIDVIPYSDDPKVYITNALSPAKVNSIKITEEPSGEYVRKHAFVMVPDSQQSLAIGRQGQNVKLAANLTGFNIEISSEQKQREDAAQAAENPSGGEAEEQQTS